jgi:hypothetical protein
MPPRERGLAFLNGIIALVEYPERLSTANPAIGRPEWIRRRVMKADMKLRVILGVVSVLFLSTLACTSLPGYHTPTLSPTITTTPSITPTPTDTATTTSTPRATRSPTPTLIPGIETPVKLGTAKVSVTNAIRRDVLECGDQIPVENPERDEWLIVTLTVISGGQVPGGDLDTWIQNNHLKNIFVQDDENNSYKYTGFCFTQDQSTGALKELYVPFEVKKSAKSFTLVITDDTRIPLDSFF